MIIKEESEDMKIEETFRVKHEDTEEQTKMVFIKEESEDMKIEETFRVKQEDTEEQTKMVFIKEESEDMKIEETFSLKQEDTEEQTGCFLFSELTHEGVGEGEGVRQRNGIHPNTAFKMRRSCFHIRHLLYDIVHLGYNNNTELA